VHLPQLASVIHDGDSGFLVARAGSAEDTAEALAQRFMDVHDGIDAGEMDPARIAGAIADFTPSRQLARVFRYHQEIQNARRMAIARSAY
jgi:hypothetical protein